MKNLNLLHNKKSLIHKKYTTKRQLAVWLDSAIKEEIKENEYNSYTEEKSVHLKAHKNKIKLKMPIKYDTSTPDPRFSYENHNILINDQTENLFKGIIE